MFKSFTLYSYYIKVSTAIEQQAQLQVATAEQILSTIVSSSYFRANEAVLKIPLPLLGFGSKLLLPKDGRVMNSLVMTF